MKCRTGIIAALVAAVTLLALAACSGGDSDTSTAAAQPDTSAANASSPDAPAVAEPEAPKLTAAEEALQHGFEITGPTGHDEDQAPEFTGLTMWLNSPPLTMTELQGEVVLVDFWTYT
ncbi:MAG: hypothetical protein OXN15_01170 [Chloroflexota bacterium]|nr:hypothetical protein [Chloroflexota bacterium]MDE2969527.1 hypothetical protein [Chloroflexota bacterium]